MNRTIKDATDKRYHYDSHDQLRQQASSFASGMLAKRVPRHAHI